MKKQIRFCCCLVVAAASLAVLGDEESSYTYDSSAKTISDGVTTINVTESAGVLTLGKVTAHRDDGVLDLSKPISDGKIITAIPALWYSTGAISGWLTELKLPETLTRIESQAFRYCSKLQKVEPCLPNALTYLGDSAFNGCSSLTGDISIGFATNAGEMVETTFGNGFQFQNAKLSKLVIGPGVSTLPANFFTSSSFKSVEFGCNLSTFSDVAMLKSVTNLVFRYAGDFTLPNQAFNGSTKLQEITWNGWFTYTTGQYVFNNWKALQCRFIVPGDNAKWLEFMADTTKFKPWADCSEDDKTTYINLYGVAAKEPAGISKSAGTGNLPRVYIVKTDVEVTDFKLTVNAPDDLTITQNPEPSADGTYSKGTVVTVTAEPIGGAKFVCWQGDVPAGCEFDQTIQVTMDDYKVLTAVSESASYTYDSSAKTISDGVTTISVTESAGALTLGNVTAHRDDGVLDLSKPISDGKIITAIPASWYSTGAISGWLTELKLPETLTRIESQAFRYCSKLQKIEPCLPNALTFLGDTAFGDASSLAGDIRFGFATNAGEMVHTAMGGGSQFKNTKLSGLVIGPGVTSLPSSFFSLASFSSVEFGCNVSTFSDGSSLTAATNLVFRHTGDFTLPNAAFNQAKNLREITWNGWFTYSPNQNVFNNWAALQCRFIVPRTNDSWNAFMADPERMTPWADCDKADKDAYFARYGADAVWPAGISKSAGAGNLPRVYIVRTLEGADDVQLNVRTTNAEMSTIVLDPQPSPETGLYPVDTQVTVTLTVRPGATFSGWEGDVAEEDRMKTTIVLTMDGQKSLLAHVKVQPEIADDSFAVSFPKGDSQPRISFALTGEEGAVYDATAEVLWMTNGTDWVVGQTLTGLVNGQTVTSWLPQAFVKGSDLKLKVRVSAASADDVTVESDWLSVEGDLPATWGKGGGAGVCHVRADATGDGSGRDWFNALAALPVAAADLPNGAKELWLATNVTCVATPNLTLTASLAVRGGFVGTECAVAERPAGVKTVLDGEDARETFKLTPNNLVTEYVFDRLVFARSLKSGLYLSAGVNPSFRIVDCDFVANGANGTVQGRGLYLAGGGDSSISNCTFRGNICRSSSGDAGEGFGAYLSGNGNRVFIDNCQFLTNGYAGVGHSTAFSAAFCAHTKVVTVRNCEFRGNRSSVYTHGSIVSLQYLSQNGGSAFTNCVFVGNELVRSENNAPGTNAGIVEMNLYSSAQKDQLADFCNCTFAYNIGGYMGGTGCGGLRAVNGTIRAENCIFFDNVCNTKGADLSGNPGAGLIKADYCLFGGEGEMYVRGGTAVTLDKGIVTGDPKFVTPRKDFLALTKNISEASLPQSGQSNPPEFKNPFSPALLALDVHVRSGRRSPAIDTGDPDGDYSMEPRPNGERLNLGAYGNTSEAALSSKGLMLLVK